MFYKPYFGKSDIRYRKSALPIACYRLQNTVISDDYYTITPNWHNEMELLYSEAALTLYINNQCYNVMPGDIFFINPRQIHRAFRKSHGEIYAVVFDLNLLKLPTEKDPTNTLIDEIIRQKKQFCVKPEQNTELHSELLPVIRNITECSGRSLEAGAESYRILSCLYSIMAASCRVGFFENIPANTLNSIQHITTLIDYINAHYADELTAECLAKRINLSPTALYSLFRDYIGVTPVNYINSVRIRESYRFLEQGMRVTETAVAVGLPNVSYFIKIFKDSTGLTPLQWINRKNINKSNQEEKDADQHRHHSHPVQPVRCLCFRHAERRKRRRRGREGTRHPQCPPPL